MNSRLIPYAVAFLLLSAAYNGSSAQGVLTSSCFELRPLADSLDAMPDSVQVLVEAEGSSRGLPRVPIYLSSIATGLFAPEGLVVRLRARRRGESYYMLFQPQGDRLVGWFMDEQDAFPDTDQPWEIEAHRFSCRSRGVP